jgi:hypothetical protein
LSAGGFDRLARLLELRLKIGHGTATQLKKTLQIIHIALKGFETRLGLAQGGILRDQLFRRHGR